jgi:hypothetical protein
MATIPIESAKGLRESPRRARPVKLDLCFMAADDQYALPTPKEPEKT